MSGPRPCPVCGNARTVQPSGLPSPWCGPTGCLNAARLYMAGKIQSMTPPYDAPRTRLRRARR